MIGSSLQLTAWKEGVWEIRPSEGKQEVVPRAEQSGHSQGQSRWERQRVRPKQRQPNPAHHSGLAIARLPLKGPLTEKVIDPDYATILYEKQATQHREAKGMSRH